MHEIFEFRQTDKTLLQCNIADLSALFLHLFLNVLFRNDSLIGGAPLNTRHSVYFWRWLNTINLFALNPALPWVLSSTPTKCEVDRMNGCQENQRAYI